MCGNKFIVHCSLFKKGLVLTVCTRPRCGSMQWYILGIQSRVPCNGLLTMNYEDDSTTYVSVHFLVDIKAAP